MTIEAGGQAIVGSVESGAARGRRSRSSDAENAKVDTFKDSDNAAEDASSKAEGYDSAITVT